MAQAVQIRIDDYKLQGAAVAELISITGYRAVGGPN